jgi:hypothetical protein
MDTEQVAGLHDGKRRRAAWIAALWVCFIYLTIPLVRTFQRWFAERFDKMWITVAVLVAMVLILVAVSVWLGRVSRRLDIWDFGVLLAVVGVAGMWAWHLRARPEEAIHLLEYGVLLVLIFRAIRPERPDLAILGTAVLLTTLMSAVDEIIQWIIPLRYFDYRDIAINGGAAVLAAVAVRRLDPGPWQKPLAPSIRQLLRMAAVLLVLMTLCLANTPARAAWYTDRIPFLGFLRYSANEMSEYGYLHRIPEIGAFKSRLDLTRLKDQDSLRAMEIAPIIRAHAGTNRQAFLDTHQGFQDPLLYEFKLHLHSRNYHRRHARKNASNPELGRYHITKAYRAHRILELCFPTTLQASGYVLPKPAADELKARQNPDQPYFSRASIHLITWTSETRLRIILLTVTVLLIAIDVLIGIRHRRRTEGTGA